jgi:hypothetical protein
MKHAWALALVFAMGCHHGPSKDECKRLLDHMVDLEFKKAGSAPASDAMKAELAKQKEAVSQAKAGEFMSACLKKTSRARVLCALNANSLEGDNGVAKCDDAK